MSVRKGSSHDTYDPCVANTKIYTPNPHQVGREKSGYWKHYPFYEYQQKEWNKGKRNKPILVGISISKKRGWKKKKRENKSTSPSSSSNEEYDSDDGDKLKFYERSDTNQHGVLGYGLLFREDARQFKNLYEGYKGHVEWFEENDKDYLEYKKNGNDMTKLSRKKQKRLKDKLGTIKYLEKEIKKIEESDYLVTTTGTRKKDVSRLYMKKRKRCYGSVKNKSYCRVRGMSAPKSKKRGDFKHYMENVAKGTNRTGKRRKPSLGYFY